jgi:hypothetical protein
MSDQLVGLEEVPWTELTHIPGAAKDIPRLLTRVARGGADYETWDALFVSLVHEGTIDSASAATVPFLISLTSTLVGDDLHAVIGLLGAIYAGVSDEGAIAERCRQAVERGLPRYVEILGDADPDVQMCVSVLVARVRDRAGVPRSALEVAFDSETDASAREELLHKLVRDTDSGVAARAAFSLLSATKHGPERVWLDAIVRELACPKRWVSELFVDDVLRAAPAFARPALLEAICDGVEKTRRYNDAFDLGHAMLWLAFGRGLGKPAHKSRNFVRVESLTFAMPKTTHGGPREWAEQYSEVFYWRTVEGFEPLAEWAWAPFVHTWERPQPNFSKQASEADLLPRVQVRDPIASESLTTIQRRVIRQLVRWDLYWHTDSDLPIVYGLPALRRNLGAFIGL